MMTCTRAQRPRGVRSRRDAGPGVGRVPARRGHQPRARLRRSRGVARARVRHALTARGEGPRGRVCIAAAAGTRARGSVCAARTGVCLRCARGSVCAARTGSLPALRAWECLRSAHGESACVARVGVTAALRRAATWSSRGAGGPWTGWTCACSRRRRACGPRLWRTRWCGRMAEVHRGARGRVGWGAERGSSRAAGVCVGGGGAKGGGRCGRA